MKKFSFFWSSLLLMVLIVGYFVALTIYISEWFGIPAVVCALLSVKLISSAFLEAQLLKKKEKYELMVALHKFGYLFLLIAFGCALVIAKDPTDPHTISATIGIGCFCMYVLSHLLRNQLESWCRKLYQYMVLLMD